MIPRLIENKVIEDLTKSSKTLLVLGARQVGKTTLIRDLETKIEKGKRIRYLNYDIEEQRSVVNTTSLTLLSQLLKDTDILFIDEAQRINNHGLTLKIIHDNFPHVKVLATGSSSFELKNKVSDAMTGRDILTLLSIHFHLLKYYTLNRKKKIWLFSNNSPMYFSLQFSLVAPNVLTRVAPLPW